jgi:16S rRNA (uracil1498-N3)-methyltransferase
MARTYRFFTRHLLGASLEQKPGQPLHLNEKLEPEIFHQLVKVLRIAPGDKVVLIPLQKLPPYLEYDYAVESAQKKEIIMRFSGKLQNENEPDFALRLVLCLPNKPDKLEFILQKAVELGVSRVTLVEGEFSRMKHNLRRERLEKIMVEAAEQSERAIVPELEIGGKLMACLESLSDNERNLVYVAMERREGAKKLQDMLGARGKGGAVTVLVGPEGGFSLEEKSLIERLDLKCFTLGRRILRMETAAILSLGMAGGC